MQSGMYLDYMVKKLAEIFVRNVLIYGASFFGEKFVVEFLSRKSLDKLTSKLGLLVLNSSYEPASLYHTITYLFMAAVLLLEF
jgi:hypothetical protein